MCVVSENRMSMFSHVVPCSTMDCGGDILTFFIPIGGVMCKCTCHLEKENVGLCPGRVKPKTIKLSFFDSQLKTQL